MKGKSHTGSQEIKGNSLSTKPVTDPSLSLLRILNLGLYYLYLSYEGLRFMWWVRGIPECEIIAFP